MPANDCENSPDPVPSASSGFHRNVSFCATKAILVCFFCIRLWSISPNFALVMDSSSAEPSIALPQTINFDKFSGYPWNDLGTSAYARILTVREFKVEYTNSSVGKFCSCDFDAIGSGWYQHENICIDGDNNVKYLNSSADVYTKQAQDLD